jgi:hypothetical protein
LLFEAVDLFTDITSKRTYDMLIQDRVIAFNLFYKQIVVPFYKGNEEFSIALEEALKEVESIFQRREATDKKKLLPETVGLFTSVISKSPYESMSLQDSITILKLFYDQVIVPIYKDNEEYRITLDVLQEFEDIFQERGGHDKVALSESLGLFTALMSKHTYGTMISGCPFMLEIFYIRVVVPFYKNKPLNIVDQSLLRYLDQDYNKEDKQLSYTDLSIKFPHFTMLLSCHDWYIRGTRMISTGKTARYLSLRIYEQCLDFIKEDYKKELAKNNPFVSKLIDKDDLEAQEASLQEQALKKECAQQIVNSIGNFLDEQKEYWQRHQKEYAEIWGGEWSLEYNVFIRLNLGGYLANGKLINGSKLVDIIQLMIGECKSENVKILFDQETYDFFHVVYGGGDLAGEAAGIILNCNGKTLDEPAMESYYPDFQYSEEGRQWIAPEFEAIKSLILSLNMVEYTQLVKEDPTVNILPTILARKGNNLGRVAEGEPLDLFSMGKSLHSNISVRQGRAKNVFNSDGRIEELEEEVVPEDNLINKMGRAAYQLKQGVSSLLERVRKWQSTRTADDHEPDKPSSSFNSEEVNQVNNNVSDEEASKPYHSNSSSDNEVADKVQDQAEVLEFEVKPEEQPRPFQSKKEEPPPRMSSTQGKIPQQTKSQKLNQAKNMKTQPQEKESLGRASNPTPQRKSQGQSQERVRQKQMNWEKSLPNTSSPKLPKHSLKSVLTQMVTLLSNMKRVLSSLGGKVMSVIGVGVVIGCVYYAKKDKWFEVVPEASFALNDRQNIRMVNTLGNFFGSFKDCKAL